MSQHFFHAVVEGHPVQVMMGWDRPLQGYFMSIERTDLPPVTLAESGDDAAARPLEDEFEDELVWDSMSLPNPFPRSLAVFRAKLAELGIRPPAGLFEAVEADARVNAGNRVVTHFAGGSCEEVFA
jgi:hypothetical protein